MQKVNNNNSYLKYVHLFTLKHYKIILEMSKFSRRKITKKKKE